MAKIHISAKWRKMAEVYRLFYRKSEDIYTQEHAEEMFCHESQGKSVSENNPYYIGKRFMDITIPMWKEDISAGILFRFELEEEFPKWFLDKVL